MNIEFMMPGVARETSNGYMRMTIQEIMFEQREIECAGEISKESAYSLILQLRYLERQDPEKEIIMYINSPGGEVASGLALYDVMQAIQCPIRTVCVGMAASMGALLLAGGDRRDILPHGRVMIHDPLLSGGMGGNALQIDNISRNLMKMREETGKLLAKHTGKTTDEIYERTRMDTWFDAQEAVEFGLVDRIIQKL